jgi:hypothetical protein
VESVFRYVMFEEFLGDAPSREVASASTPMPTRCYDLVSQALSMPAFRKLSVPLKWLKLGVENWRARSQVPYL